MTSASPAQAQTQTAPSAQSHEPPLSSRRWQTLLSSFVLFFILAAAAFWNWQSTLEREAREASQRFTLEVDGIGQDFHERMRAYEMVLRGLSGAFTGATADVSKEQWDEMMERLQIQLLYPGISSLAWSRQLYPEQVLSFLGRVRRDVDPNFQIFPAAESDHHNVIEYIFPLNSRTKPVLGLDLLTQNVQNRAVTQAIDSGDAILSTPLLLYSNGTISEIRQMGAFMYLPIYQEGQPPVSLEERQKTLLGLVNIAFRGQELVESIFGSQLHLFRIHVHDLETGIPLFDSQEITPPADSAKWVPRFHAERQLSLYGRVWTLDIVGTPEYENGLMAGRLHNLTFLLELVVSALIALMAASFLLSRDRKLHASAQLAARLREQARQLMLANRYKSEFLANMSHELRTPLNSILILSDQLRQNAAGNLTEKQTRHADIVHRAGSDLLQLINDVLDLAKIEAGRMQANLEPITLPDLLIDLDAGMQPLAQAKGLNLHISTMLDDSGVPTRIQTDRVRLHQILRNLLSNALKFTDRGQVQLMVSRGETLDDGRVMINFAVRDTGIGIADEHQREVFNAFTQIDGSTKRRFGGTGLGLAITRQLVEALDGTIELESAVGQGSTFTVRLPCYPVSSATVAENTPPQRSGTGPQLLIVEDDKNFAASIMEKACASGFSCVHCLSGNQALDLLQRENFVAVILDLLLPDISGWQLFRRLRAMEKHRTTPVHIISCLPHPGHLPSEQGTHYLTKPLDKQEIADVLANLRTEAEKGLNLLLVEDVEHEREHYSEKLRDLGFNVTAAESIASAADIWRDGQFEVIVLDFNLPDGDGFSLLETLDGLRPLEGARIIINTGIDMDGKGLQKLDNYSAVMVHKKGEDVSQLAQAVQGFLGQIPMLAAASSSAAAGVVAGAAPSQFSSQSSPQVSHLGEVPASSPVPAAIQLKDRRLLLVDDDVRNVYAMSALLDEFGFDIITAGNGEEAIARFNDHKPDLILMDMSMPVMDGYRATNLLKTQHECQVPIIAMTAHAMVGDREKCLAAGTDDYIAKPVKREELQEIFARWLSAAPES